MSASVACPEQERLENRGAYTQQELDAMSAEQLLALYKGTGDQSLKWPLVLRYEGLIKTIALQICGVYSSFAQVDDIINEGVITLLRAVDKYDPTMGTKFETYVTKRIRGMIIDMARRQDWLPRSVRRRSREIDQAAGELYSTLGHYPTDEEMSSRLGVTTAKYQAELAGMSLCSIISLEGLFEGREQGDAGMAFPGREGGDQPEQALQERELKEKLVEGIRSLQKSEQTVLSLYYEQEFNMREIAQIMGVSEPRISQIHSRAIQKLRLFLNRYLELR